MDRKTRLAGRNAAPPAAGAAPCSSEKDGKRTMLDSFTKTFRRSYFPALILDSQVKVFSRLKGLKSGSGALKGAKDGGQVKSSLIPPLLASPQTAPKSRRGLPPRCLELEPRHIDSVDADIKEPMHSQLVLASQKRKQPQEHDDAPSRTKAKSRPMADDTEKRHIVQEWVNRQDEPVSPTPTQMDLGAGDSVPWSLTPPIMDDHDGSAIHTTRNGSLTPFPGLNRELLDSLVPHGPSREFVESILHHGSSTAHQSEPQAVTSSPQPFKNDERRGSTATTTNLTYRDSVFSSCPSVATGLTSPSEISLVLTASQRIHSASRSSSFFSKASPRSSIASSVPSPHSILHRAMSSNSAGRFEETHDLAKHPLPDVPRADPLRSHPTFFGMDIGNVQNAVIIDQVVKMGHLAQERRVNSKPFFDKAQLLVAPTPSAPNDLTTIKETASDDGASSDRKLQLHGHGSTLTQHPNISDSHQNETLESTVVCRSTPGTPESTDRLSDTMTTGDKTSQNHTPATSVTVSSDMSMGEVASPQSDESDDSLSDITDYTEESLFEAVEAFGPGFANPLMLSIILTFKDDVLRLVLARITAMLGDDNGATQHNNGESSGSSTGPSSSDGSSQNQNPASQRNHPRKRELDGNRDGSGEDDGDDRGKRTKPSLAIPSDLEMRYSRLACPFFKRFPETKWKGACCGPGFPTVHRIKEHVYRKHDHPYCQRCHSTFNDEKGLEEHAQAETPCTVQKGPLRHQGITPEQRTRLKSRKKLNRDANRTEADRWTELYSLLFPEVPREQIPSPNYDFKSYENLLSPNMAAAFRQLLDEDLPTRIARQLEDRLRLIPGAQSNFVQAQLPDMIRTCIQEALSNVPPQLLTGDEPTPLRESQLDPPAGTAKGPDSHGTAQIGSQFASIAPPQETPVPSEQDLPEVTLPSHSQLWVPIPDQLDLGAIFGEDYFPNPLAETADGLRESNSSQSFPTATAFTTIGFPSAMLAGTPVPSPSLLPDLSFDRFDFAGAGTLSFHGALGNMPNSAFLFTQEDKPSSNGNVAGHQLDQYTY